MSKDYLEAAIEIAQEAGKILREEFDRLHGISVKLEGTVLLIGFAALFLTVREMVVARS